MAAPPSAKVNKIGNKLARSTNNKIRSRSLSPPQSGQFGDGTCTPLTSEVSDSDWGDCQSNAPSLLGRLDDIPPAVTSAKLIAEAEWLIDGIKRGQERLMKDQDMLMTRFLKRLGHVSNGNGNGKYTSVGYPCAKAAEQAGTLSLGTGCPLSIPRAAAASMEPPTVARKAGQEKQVTFMPGRIGVKADWGTGFVDEVFSGGQGESLGVQVGWRFQSIDGHPYTADLLRAKIESGYAYSVCFLEEVVQEQPAGDPKATGTLNGVAMVPSTYTEGVVADARKVVPAAPAAVPRDQPQDSNPFDDDPGDKVPRALNVASPSLPFARAGSGASASAGTTQTPTPIPNAARRALTGADNIENELKSMCNSATVLRDETEHVANAVLKALGAEWADPYLRMWEKYWATIEEPRRTGRLAHFVQSHLFEGICFVVILINGAFIVLATDRAMEHIGEAPPVWLKLTELWFYLCYVIEFGLRFAVHGFYLFCNQDMAWNTFDFVVINLVTIDVAMSFQDLDASHNANAAYIRLVRLFRIVKILRAVRGLRQISEIKVVLDMVLQSFMSLIRCIMLLFFILSGFAIFFVQAAATYIEDVPLDEREQSEVYIMFGSVSMAMISLFEAVSGGIDWGTQFNALDQLGAESKTVYVFFILFFTIAFWNILTGHFIDGTLKMATTDWEEMMLEKRKKDHNDAHKLMRVVREEEGNLTHISMDDFKRLMKRDDVRSYFEARGIEISDGALLFKMLTGGSNDALDLSTFIWGCLRLKGMATSIDLHSLDFEVRIMHRDQQVFAEQVMNQLDMICGLIQPAAQGQQEQTPHVEDDYVDTGIAPRTLSRAPEWAI